YRANRKYLKQGKAAPLDLSERARTHLLVMIHIPKAGGTTIKNLLAANYGSLYQDHHRKLNDLSTSPETLGRLRALSAHARFGYETRLIAAYTRTVPQPDGFDIRHTHR